MKTLDELATEVRALTAEIDKANILLDTTQNFIYQKWLAKSQVIDEAFKRIPARAEREKWCKKAEIALVTAKQTRPMSRAKDPEKWLKDHHAVNVKHVVKYAKRKRAENKEANTFPGAFAIMVQSLDQQTPAEFMAFPSVHEADIISLIEFLKEAIE